MADNRYIDEQYEIDLKRVEEMYAEHGISMEEAQKPITPSDLANGAWDMAAGAKDLVVGIGQDFYNDPTGETFKAFIWDKDLNWDTDKSLGVNFAGLGTNLFTLGTTVASVAAAVPTLGASIGTRVGLAGAKIGGKKVLTTAAKEIAEESAETVVKENISMNPFSLFGKKVLKEGAEATAKTPPLRIATSASEDAGDALKRLTRDGVDDIAPKAAETVEETATKLSGRALQREGNKIAKDIRGPWYSPNKIKDKGTLAAATREELKDIAANPHDVFRISDKAARVALEGNLGWKATTGTLSSAWWGAKQPVLHPFRTAAIVGTGVAVDKYNGWGMTEAAVDLVTGNNEETVPDTTPPAGTGDVQATPPAMTANADASSLISSFSDAGGFSRAWNDTKGFIMDFSTKAMGGIGGGMSTGFNAVADQTTRKLGAFAEHYGVPAELAGAIATFAAFKMMMGGNLLPMIGAAIVTYLAPDLFKPAQEEAPAPVSAEGRNQLLKDVTLQSGPAM